MPREPKAEPNPSFQIYFLNEDTKLKEYRTALLKSLEKTTEWYAKRYS